MNIILINFLEIYHSYIKFYGFAHFDYFASMFTYKYAYKLKPCTAVRYHPTPARLGCSIGLCTGVGRFLNGLSRLTGDQKRTIYGMYARCGVCLISGSAGSPVLQINLRLVLALIYQRSVCCTVCHHHGANPTSMPCQCCPFIAYFFKRCADSINLPIGQLDSSSSAVVPATASNNAVLLPPFLRSTLYYCDQSHANLFNCGIAFILAREAVLFQPAVLQQFTALFVFFKYSLYRDIVRKLVTARIVMRGNPVFDECIVRWFIPRVTYAATSCFILWLAPVASITAARGRYSAETHWWVHGCLYQAQPTNHEIARQVVDKCVWHYPRTPEAREPYTHVCAGLPACKFSYLLVRRDFIRTVALRYIFGRLLYAWSWRCLLSDVIYTGCGIGAYGNYTSGYYSYGINLLHHLGVPQEVISRVQSVLAQFTLLATGGAVLETGCSLIALEFGYFFFLWRKFSPSSPSVTVDIFNVLNKQSFILPTLYNVVLTYETAIAAACVPSCARLGLGDYCPVDQAALSYASIVNCAAGKSGRQVQLRFNVVGRPLLSIFCMVFPVAAKCRLAKITTLQTCIFCGIIASCCFFFYTNFMQQRSVVCKPQRYVSCWQWWRGFYAPTTNTISVRDLQVNRDYSSWCLCIQYGIAYTSSILADTTIVTTSHDPVVATPTELLIIGGHRRSILHPVARVEMHTCAHPHAYREAILLVCASVYNTLISAGDLLTRDGTSVV